MVLAAEFGTGQVLWDMLWFFLFLIWIWLLIVVFTDIFRSGDLAGWAKALWTILIIVLPYLGVFVYLVARGQKMHEHAAQAARQQDDAMRRYMQGIQTPDGGAAGEIRRLADLREKGVISEEEFQRGKAKALA